MNSRGNCPQQKYILYKGNDICSPSLKRENIKDGVCIARNAETQDLFEMGKIF